jgi:hypothetical protein
MRFSVKISILSVQKIKEEDYISIDFNKSEGIKPMKTFKQWAKESSKELPELPAQEENTKRAGIRAAYPDAYVRAQYPAGYFTPIAADAPVQLQNAKKK